MRVTRLVTVLTGALALATTIACSTATPTGTPGVDSIGKTMLRYRGPELDVIISYGFANANPGDEWLFIDTSITGNTGTSVEIKRKKIAIRTPKDEIIPLASQEDFGAAYPTLAASLARANIASQPMATYPGRVEEPLDLLVPPGSGIVQESVWVNQRTVAVGRLYFEIPTGVQAGPYELRIDLEESKIRIPFRLGPEH